MTSRKPQRGPAPENRTAASVPIREVRASPRELADGLVTMLECAPGGLNQDMLVEVFCAQTGTGLHGSFVRPASKSGDTCLRMLRKLEREGRVTRAKVQVVTESWVTDSGQLVPHQTDTVTYWAAVA